MKTKTTIQSILFLFILLAFPVGRNLFAQSVGDPAPDFTLSTDAGYNFTLSENEGKVIFIFFFGYACPHCLANGNNTETAIYEVYKNNHDFVAIGIDTWDGNESGVASFKSSTDITYPLCYMGSSVESTYLTTYDRIVVIDKEGVIRYKSTANATAEIASAASDVVEEYLADMAPSALLGRSQENNGSSLLIYPVPAKDNLFIGLPDGSPGSSDVIVTILNTGGQIVAKHKLADFLPKKNHLKISVEDLPNGVYFVEYTDLKAKYTGRAIVRND